MPPQKLVFTGERYVPEIHGNIELEHLHRYLLAGQVVAGKTVLDIASGEGYGSAMLARTAHKVTGVDISEEAISHAQAKYQAKNLEFRLGSCSAIPLGDASVDVVVSFETIEHHDEHEVMMREIKRVLRPGGVLIISSPDKQEYSDKPGYRNPHHVKELYRGEFKKLLDLYFKNHCIYGQRVVYGSAIFCEDSISPIESYELADDVLSAIQGVPYAVYLVAVASDAELPFLGSGILEQPINETELVQGWAGIVADRDDQVVQLLKTIDSLIVDRDAQRSGVEQLRQLHDQLAVQRDTQVAGLATAIAERDGQIVSLNQAVAERDVRNSAITRELQTILSSRSWKITRIFRLAGRIFRRDWAAVQASIRSWQEAKEISVVTEEGKHESRNTAMNDELKPLPCTLTPPTLPMDTYRKRILLVSYYCPSRAHGGGLRILDIYSLNTASFPEVIIDLYTHKRPEIDWSYSDIEHIFDQIYFSPVEELSPGGLSELCGVPRRYDVIDLQFHQSAHHLDQWHTLGGKILFTPMESLVRSLVTNVRAVFRRDTSYSLRTIIAGIKSAAEEIVFASKVDEVVCVSRTDASLLRLMCQSKKINFLETAISNIEFSDAIGNKTGELKPEHKKYTILYVAYFGSETNVIALKWYLENIHSLVRKAVPEYILQVVGRGDLSNFNDYQSNSIEFVGEVPTLAPYIDAAKVGIAPALGGSGFRGKINQYAIFGVPSVASSVSAKGLAYEDGIDIYITDEPNIFADRCIRLLKDNELNKTMGQQAREKAFSEYSWESRLDAIRKIYALEEA